MDILPKEECQAIIDAVDVWEPKTIIKRGRHDTNVGGWPPGTDSESGRPYCGTLQFKQAPANVWHKRYPDQLILQELLMKYDVGDFCTEHRDSPWRKIHPNYTARAVWITPLNDDYEGGEVYFDGELVEQVVGVPIKRLRVTPHEITKITKGTRYSLVSWVFIKKEIRADR